MNFYDLLKNRTKNFGEKIFLRVDEKIFTYRNFLQKVDSAEIFGDGEIFIKPENFLDGAIKFFAAQKSGKIPILLHSKINFSEIKNPGAAPGCVIGVLTGGSTGTAKILYRNYASWADFFPEQNKIFKTDENAKIFIHGSLSFTGNLNTFLAILYAGGTIYTTEKFSPGIWQKIFAEINSIYLVPAKLSILPPDGEFKNIRSIFTGSQLLNEKKSRVLMKKFPAAEIFVYYGASELNFVTYKKISPENIDDVKNLGKPFKGVSVEIRDGFIFVENKFGAAGIKMPACVGDRGNFDREGNLIFEGRGEDFINRGGVKFSAADIESRLLKIPEIENAAVVKIFDEIRGENFRAYIVAGENLRKKIRRTINSLEIPGEIVFVKFLPLNDCGKISKEGDFFE